MFNHKIRDKSVDQNAPLKQEVLFKARKHITAHRFTSAIKLVKTCPDWEKNGACLLLISECYEKQHYYHSAIQMCLKHHDVEFNVSNLIRLAQCYEQTAQFNLAEQMYLKILRFKYDCYANLCLATLYKNTGEFAKAIACYKKDLHWVKNNELIKSIAYCYWNLQEYEFSIDTLLLISKWSSDKDVITLMSECYLKTGQFLNALNTLELYEKEDFNISLAIAHCYQIMSIFPQAIQKYNEIYLKYSGFAEKNTVLYYLGECFSQFQYYEQAIACYLFLKNSVPTEPVHDSIGYCYDQLGDYNQAIYHYELALELNNTPETHHNLATCYFKIGQYPIAEQCYRTLIKADKHDKLAQIGLAYCLVYSEKFEKARSFIEHIKAWKKEPALIYLYARLLNHQGQSMDAADFLLLDGFEFKDNVAYFIELLNSYVLIQDETKIQALQKAALKKFPDSPLLAAFLLEQLIKSDLPKAIKQAEEYVTKYPFDKQISLLKDRINELQEKELAVSTCTQLSVHASLNLFPRSAVDLKIHKDLNNERHLEFLDLAHRVPSKSR